MTNKKLLMLASAAVALGVTAYVTSSGRKVKTPALNGRSVVEAFNAADVAKVEISGKDKLTLVAGDKGWTVASCHGYPADVAKIRENILKLTDLKVGQVARGRKIASPVKVALYGADGGNLASLELGDQRMSRPRGQAAQFGGGGYPDGRYVKYGEHVVLVKDALDAFDGDFRKWVDTRICEVPSADVVKVSYAKGGEKAELERKDSTWTMKGLSAEEELDSSKTYSLDSALSYLDMNGVADPSLTEAAAGFTTGSVYTVTLKDGKSYTAKVGNASGSDRYFKVSASFAPVGTNAVENAALEKSVKEFNERTARWTYLISSYSADSMSKTRKDLVKAKEEPKEEKKKSGGADAE
jgi:hypothetical protein